MQHNTKSAFAYCLFRGFSVQEDGPAQIIIRHRKTRGKWVFGSYSYMASKDEHIIREEDRIEYTVFPDTIGIREPISGRWPGDTCFYEGIRGVVRFGRHSDPTTYKREEVHYYIDWIGDEFKKTLWRSDLLFWTKQPDLIWSGTIWDSKSEYQHFMFNAPPKV